MSPPRDHGDGVPALARWLGRYLGAAAFALSIVSGAIGMLIAVTLAVSDTNHRLDSAAHRLDEHDKVIDGLTEHNKTTDKDMVSVDHRLNEAKNDLINAEREQDKSVAEIRQKEAVLEEQLKLFGQRTVPLPAKEP